MKRGVGIALGASTLAVALSACWGMTIDVGTNDRDAAVPIADASEDTAPPVFSDAKPDPVAQCGASGQIERYFSAKELTDRLLGVWGECPHDGVTPLPCIPPTRHPGIRFEANGRFAILGTREAGADYIEMPAPCGPGTFKIFALIQGGILDGASSEYVPLDDPTPRNGLEVHLFVDDGEFDIELVDFEKNPERLFMRERGNIATRAYYVRATTAEK